MAPNVMAIDQGTTGTTVLILDPSLNVLGKGYCEFPQVYPQPGWVEHDLTAIWESVTTSVGRALSAAQVDASSIGAIGITNQRETTAVWDRKTGEPIHNAIVWQCRRTSARCDELNAAGHADLFRSRTGLVLDAYFSGTKVQWLLDNVDGARARAEAGELAFGTIDSYLVWRLTGGAVHVTDVSNASRTLLFDIHKLQWDSELCEVLDVPQSLLPGIVGNSEIYGHTVGMGVLPAGIPVAGMAGDQQAALFGQACFSIGEAKCTYGTGAFLLVNTGDTPCESKHGLLTTVGWRIGDKTTYAIEGSAFIAGAAVQWLRDGLGLLGDSAEVEGLAGSVPDSGGVVFVPALAGLGAPHWRQDARGAFFGITRGTTQAHFARAVLDGIALQIADILGAMAEDLGAPLVGLRVDGGASKNNLLMQFQSDVLNIPILRPAMVETTALGAAFLAGLAVGIWSDLEEIRSTWREDRRFTPTMADDDVAGYLARWKRAVERA